MDSSKLNDWLKVAGLFGVIASLLFVGLEIQQSRQIARADTYQQRTALFIQLMTSYSQPDRVADAREKLRTNQPLTPQEKRLASDPF